MSLVPKIVAESGSSRLKLRNYMILHLIYFKGRGCSVTPCAEVFVFPCFSELHTVTAVRKSFCVLMPLLAGILLFMMHLIAVHLHLSLRTRLVNSTISCRRIPM